MRNNDSYKKGYKRIDNDNHRFKQIIKGKIRKNFQKYIKNHALTGKEGDKIVKIPVPEIELPKLRYDTKQTGGVAQGPGDVGDVLGKDNEANEGEGSGEAGNNESKHTFDAELTIDELASMLGETLELPNIEPKEKCGQTKTTSKKYISVNKFGPEGLRIFKRTYKKALLRTIASGEYHHDDPKSQIIIPRQEDKFYKYAKEIKKPDVKVAVFYIMDVSGSMNDKKREIVRTICYWIDLWLQKNYHDKIENRYIIHDTKAIEIERESFYKVNTSGGTIISRALQLCDNIINEDYDPNIWNIYIFQFSDGDSWGQDDNIISSKLIFKLKRKVNQYNYCEINTSSARDTFIGTLERIFGVLQKRIKFIKIRDRDGISDVIKKFFK
tara:strand:- start:13403 stop:14551 length:1149 start_codon:yes stop_codon:yes gene_type:complete